VNSALRSGLFSQIDAQLYLKTQPLEPFTETLPQYRAGTAVIVELDGRDAIGAGLELARQGWRPVPLFNATTGHRPVVDMLPVMQGLLAGAEVLAAVTVRPNAAPAFLIDARRMSGTPSPGAYDNRSIVLPQDFPSATMLISHGIREVVLVQLGTGEPREDLSHVLLRWQQAGLALRRESTRGQAEALALSPPSWFRKAWYRVIALFGLRRNNVGGFGATVPEATSAAYRGYG
jgi:hypothetical protein